MKKKLIIPLLILSVFAGCAQPQTPVEPAQPQKAPEVTVLDTTIIEQPVTPPEELTAPPAAAPEQPPAEEPEAPATEAPACDYIVSVSQVSDTAPLPRNSEPERPMIALTFDDGPGAYTEQLLDTFAAHDAKGTFFIVGGMAYKYPETLQRMAEEGHDIGNHSWNHPPFTTLSNDEIVWQVTKTREKVLELAGVEPSLIRLPYGDSSSRVRSVCAQLGSPLIYWSVDPQDWNGLTADEISAHITSRAHEGAIILCHDTNKTTVNSMEYVIPALIEAGYQLVTVTELLTAHNGEMEPGVVYSRREPHTPANTNKTDAANAQQLLS